MTREVPRTHGQVALIDDEDWDKVRDHKWHAVESYRGSGSWYAKANIWIDGKYRTVALHRLVMNAPKGTTVDHRDLNTLDCRKANLRFATRKQQSANRGIPSNNKTGFKGVYFFANRFRVSINSRFLKGAAFHTAEEAARAYDRAALDVFGEFAHLNFPLEATR